MSTVLATQGLSVRFGGVHALNDVDLQVQEGQLVGLIGPNGAGKTTFIDAITGFVSSTGEVELEGTNLTGMSPDARAHRGLTRTWQAAELFDDLTVRENLTVAARRASWRDTLRDIFTGSTPEDRSVHAALELLELGDFAELLPGELTQGQRKLVGVARALAAQPHIVCLDEPAAGLDTSESEELGRKLRQIVDSGTPVLLIDHDMGLVLSICDHVVVLEFGKVIAQGPPDVVTRDPKVIEAYLGGAGADVADEVQAAASEAAADAGTAPA
ncbi:MAG: branched-chain amino acid transport system ATP-binding protein [Solirubrobacteraceae bacterium]|jgi:branched-chain amino acid transport system ATP-binding protein|nr:branched-chain amino acid transport system ATP-binding protein [Solirubrobacteraceae bacterium]